MLTPRQVRWLRVAAVLALVVAALILGRVTGFADALTRENLRATVAAAGAWGPPLYVAAFTAAVLFHMPAGGILFVAVAVMVYGKGTGAVLAYGGALVGVLFSFAVVRLVGGKPLGQIRNNLLRRVLDRLEARPLLTVIALRLCFFAGAPVNYALALSPLRLRDYALGSVVGLVPPVLVLALFFELLVGL